MSDNDELNVTYRIDTTTYREELTNLNIGHSKKFKDAVSNFNVKIFTLLNSIISMSNRGKGYLNHISKGRSNLISIDLLNVLKDVINDNYILFNEEDSKLCSKLVKYIELINDNLDEIIRSDINIIYDEDEPEDQNEININCDMISESFTLINDIIASLSCK
jgi:hypothetical protein